jgi:hypothetical protein
MAQLSGKLPLNGLTLLGFQHPLLTEVRCGDLGVFRVSMVQSLSLWHV